LEGYPVLRIGAKVIGGYVQTMKYIAYTDGSYKKLPNGKEAYSSAAIVAPEGSNDWKVMAKAANDEYIVHHNISGEIFAVLMVLEYLLTKTDCTEVTIVYDQQNIGLWATGVYSARTQLSKAYVQYLQLYVKPKMKVNWVNVKGHGNTAGNNLVDKIAKSTLNEYLEKE